MEPAMNLGLAIARKAGVAFSAVKISTTVPIIDLAKMELLAAILDKDLILVLALLDGLVPIAKFVSPTNVLTTFALTVEPVRELVLTITLAFAPWDSMAFIANLLPKSVQMDLAKTEHFASIPLQGTNASARPDTPVSTATSKSINVVWILPAKTVALA